MAQTTIALSDEQLARLQRHAEASQRSLDELVGEAVDAYLTRLTTSAASDAADEPSLTTWTPPERRLGADGMMVSIPAALSPEEAEELLAQPSPLARGDYMRGWLRKRGGGIVHEPPPGPPDPAWQARFDETLARIRAHVPPDITPEEIESLITEASEEVRQERRARQKLV